MWGSHGRVIWSIWDPFWIDFGSQDGPKIDQKSIHKLIKQIIDFVIYFESIFEPFSTWYNMAEGTIVLEKPIQF